MSTIRECVREDAIKYMLSIIEYNINYYTERMQLEKLDDIDITVSTILVDVYGKMHKAIRSIEE